MINEIKEMLKGKKGLEIGGPSAVFQDGHTLPIYSIVSNLDGCNFAETTIWEGPIKEGWNYKYYGGKNCGYQFIREATDLEPISSCSYDFVLASHVLEHIANPIKALHEWLRVLKSTGTILVVVPWKDGTFDHNRPVTTLNHLMEDFNRDIGEGDLSHLSEILQFHDLVRDPLAGNYEAFKARSKENLNNRCLHHHIFSCSLVEEIFSYLGIRVLAAKTLLPYHITVMGQKVL